MFSGFLVYGTSQQIVVEVSFIRLLMYEYKAPLLKFKSFNSPKFKKSASNSKVLMA
ncbi:hypothetical protein ES703_86632 [subsurface metagenome]